MAQDTVKTLQAGIDASIEQISEKHRMHRKIQFLLDIRGLLIINKLEGQYAEFGVYRGEMMYAAAKILGKNVQEYLGFDTFEGLPQPEGADAMTFVFETPGFMACPEDHVNEIMKGFPTRLVKGDFRTPQTQEEIRATLKTISVLSLDGNWPSSVEASLDVAGPHLVSGSVVFFDDYFVGTRSGDYMVPLIQAAENKYGLRFHYFKTYPPCARGFVIEKNDR